MLLGGLQRRQDLSSAALGIATQWRQFMERATVPGEVGGNCYGVICGVDATSMEYICGVEVESLDALPEGTGRMRVPAQRYAVFVHNDRTATLQSTWQQVFAWLSNSEFESAQRPDFELYGPGIDPLAPHERVEIWIGVVPRDPKDGRCQ
jgi:predicted transcriptional regulator YdeE